MSDEFTLAESAAQFILSQTGLRPKIGLILVQGLADSPTNLPKTRRFPTRTFHRFRNQLQSDMRGGW